MHRHKHRHMHTQTDIQTDTEAYMHIACKHDHDKHTWSVIQPLWSIVTACLGVHLCVDVYRYASMKCMWKRCMVSLRVLY